MNILKQAYIANATYCPRSADLLDAAVNFAADAHAGQVRKYTDEPYIVHPINVARIVMEVFPDVDAVCAAYLHDTIEDCGVGTKDLFDRGFGPRVVSMVLGLTDVSREWDGNRAERKRIDREHTAKQDNLTKLVKLADLLDNTCSIVKHDKKFAKVYLKEKLLLLPHLCFGHPLLHEVATTQCYMGIKECM